MKPIAYYHCLICKTKSRKLVHGLHTLKVFVSSISESQSEIPFRVEAPNPLRQSVE